jgi:peroxiredoxin
VSELQGLGAQLSEAEQAGVEIIAISPDPNERSQQLAEGLHLGYRFVADRDLAVSRRFGLIHAGGGPDGQDVPRPATVVLDRAGVSAWFAPSWRKRARIPP